MSFRVEKIPGGNTLLGEGPHWDIKTQSLYFVDVFGKKFLRFDYGTQQIYRCELESGPEMASFIIPIEGSSDKFVTAIGRSILTITWDGLSPTCKIDKEITAVEQLEKFNNNHFNDGKCDSRGRLFTGTMNNDFVKNRTGSLYRLDKNGAKLLKDNVGLSNGLVWNDVTKKFYYADSMDFKVREYDYDIETGDISNPKIIYNIESLQKFDRNLLLPDGMTIDSEGFVYLAIFGASKVVKIDPKSCKVLLEIAIPCEQVTSVAFGGPKLDILYVTTGGLEENSSPGGETFKILRLSAPEGKPSLAGETFRVIGLGAKGLPMMKYKPL